MKLLLRTVTGSHLYGLANEDSDYDYMEVYGWDKFRGRQRITDDSDYTRQSFDRFMRYCDKGVPQYLEALWSQKAEVDEFPFNRWNYRPDMANVRDTYRRTIKNFWLSGWEEGSFKKRRHAVRLQCNLNQMEWSGNFNPTLDTGLATFVNQQANNPRWGDLYDVL